MSEVSYSCSAFDDGTGGLSRWGLPLLLLAFLVTSMAAAGQPVTSMEMNRNDAACYLILADNMVHNGVYSLSRSEPYLPQTEWPPGTPLLYTVPVAIAGGLPQASTEWLFHGWALLISVASLTALYRWLRLVADVPISLAAVAATAFSRAFLDSGQATVADTAAVGLAFFCLRLLHLHFNLPPDQRPNRVLLYGSLALLPLTKPYLGLVFVAWLWRVMTQLSSWKQRLQSLLIMGLCCLPFVAFMVYSVAAAEATGQISAVTWLTTSNPVEVREGVDAASDHVTLAERLESARHTLQYFLVYHVTTAPLPVLDWAGLRDWPIAIRGIVVLLIAATMLRGLLSERAKRFYPEVAFAAALFVFFMLLACDSARFFTVLTPVCALLFVLGAAAILESFQWQLCAPRMLHVTLAAAAVSGVCWSQRQLAADLDPDPLFSEIYKALDVAHGDDRIGQLRVPLWVRDVTVVETQKDVVGVVEPAALTSLPVGTAVLFASRDSNAEEQRDQPVGWQSCYTSADQRVRLLLKVGRAEEVPATE